jgi:pyrimidine operon attenuation protein/uracil phosphoribosyltransferase
MPQPTLPPLPDAEQLFAQLVEQLRNDVTFNTARLALVGIHTGGVWLAERLHAALQLQTPLGCIDVSYHRDDYASRGNRNLPRGDKPSSIPFAVEGAHIVIVDDVLYTGRTIRAAMNELFDYGRPGHIDLAVLVDRGGRELPIDARYCAHRLAQALPAQQKLRLTRSSEAADAALTLELVEQVEQGAA